MAKFRFGEIAVLLYCETWPENPECDCQIIGTARLFRASYDADGSFALKDFLFSMQYVVVDEAGDEWVVLESKLRKKRPPEICHETSGWAECPWQPTQSSVARSQR